MFSDASSVSSAHSSSEDESEQNKTEDEEEDEGNKEEEKAAKKLHKSLKQQNNKPSKSKKETQPEQQKNKPGNKDVEKATQPKERADEVSEASNEEETRPEQQTDEPRETTTNGEGTQPEGAGTGVILPDFLFRKRPELSNGEFRNIYGREIEYGDCNGEKTGKGAILCAKLLFSEARWSFVPETPAPIALHRVFVAISNIELSLATLIRVGSVLEGQDCISQISEALRHCLRATYLPMIHRFQVARTMASLVEKICEIQLIPELQQIVAVERGATKKHLESIRKVYFLHLDPTLSPVERRTAIREEKAASGSFCWQCFFIESELEKEQCYGYGGTKKLNRNLNDKVDGGYKTVVGGSILGASSSTTAAIQNGFTKSRAMCWEIHFKMSGTDEAAVIFEEMDYLCSQIEKVKITDEDKAALNSWRCEEGRAKWIHYINYAIQTKKNRSMGKAGLKAVASVGLGLIPIPGLGALADAASAAAEAAGEAAAIASEMGALQEVFASLPDLDSAGMDSADANAAGGFDDSAFVSETEAASGYSELATPGMPSAQDVASKVGKGLIKKGLSQAKQNKVVQNVTASLAMQSLPEQEKIV